MSTITLPAVFSNASGELEAVVPLLLRQDYSLAVVQRVWKAYRLRGIVELFLTGSASGCSENLQKSALVAVHHLTVRGIHGLALSQLTPFFDALAGGVEAVGDEIARRSADATHLADLEYPDDFLYVRYLMSRCVGDETAAAISLSELRRLLDGEDTPQLAICEAIDSSDGARLGEALEARLLEHEDRYRLLLQRGAVAEEEWVSEGHFSVEGLAIIRLAARFGMTLATNYKFVPSIAIRARAPILPADAWQSP